jgi:hypothetical protein
LRYVSAYHSASLRGDDVWWDWSNPQSSPTWLSQGALSRMTIKRRRYPQKLKWESRDLQDLERFSLIALTSK